MLWPLPRYCSASEMIASAKTDFYTVMRKVWASGNSILGALGQKHDSPVCGMSYLKLHADKVIFPFLL